MSRRRLQIVLFAGLLLRPAGLVAQCTKDTDCKYDRICVNGACVSPQDSQAVRPPGQVDQKRAACAQKCQHEQSKCDDKIRDGDSDAQLRHRSCFVDHQRCLSTCDISW